MFNIKKKITVKTIFFIIIFIYNKKFILNAAELCNKRSTEKRFDESKEMQKAYARMYAKNLLEQIRRNTDTPAEAYKKYAQVCNYTGYSYRALGKELENMGNKNAAEIKYEIARFFFNCAANNYSEQSKSLLQSNDTKGAILALEEETAAFRNAESLYAESYYKEERKLLEEVLDKHLKNQNKQENKHGQELANSTCKLI